jgi:1-aminocyclopropane-1-carboxylate deaminase
MQHTNFQTAQVVTLQKKLYQHKNVQVAVLRLDEIHPVISGNKWFKLKAYLEDAQALQKKTILTFGGAFSNHIVATAAAAPLFGFQSVGIIRGEQPQNLSPTLQQASALGIQLFFTTREDYKNKKIPAAVWEKAIEDEVYIVGEGGYGLKGAEGAKAILAQCNSASYTHILAAVGTGTMLAGLTAAAVPHQKVIGISVLKNYWALADEVQALLPGTTKGFEIVHDFHFGGYAKHTPQLIEFMNDWYRQTGIPSDFVYTAKLFYATEQMIQQDYFAAGSRLLLVHSGGLQGNRSLPKGTLIF